MAAKATSGGFEPKAIRPPDGALWSAATSPPSSRRTDRPEPKERPAPEPKGPPAAAEAKPGKSDQGARKPARVGSAGIPLAPLLGCFFSSWPGLRDTSTGTIPRISSRRTTRSSRRASSPSRHRSRATSRRFRSPTTSTSNKGGVIAEIDQRDYLAALAQAEAQVAGGASRHPQHRRADRHARRADRREPGAGGSGAGESGARAGHLGTRQAARQSGLGDGSAGHDRRPGLSRPSRPRSTARKRRSKSRSGKSTR